MKFHLEASLRLSADASDAKDAISDFIRDAGPILVKGAPEGQGAKITEWRLARNRIDLVIDSDRYVRAHDALLRLRRPLSELLGKQYRIGVRGIDITAFEIDVQSEKSIEHRIPYVKEMVHEGGRLRLILDVGEGGTLGQSEIENRIPDRIISLLEEKMESSYGGKTEHWELLWRAQRGSQRAGATPQKRCKKRAGSSTAPPGGSGSMGPKRLTSSEHSKP